MWVTSATVGLWLVQQRVNSLFFRVCVWAGARTLILRILASNRSCFTALWAIIRLLLALLLDMAAAAFASEKLRAVFCEPSGNEPGLLQSLDPSEKRWSSCAPPPLCQQAMLLGSKPVNQKVDLKAAPLHTLAITMSFIEIRAGS